MAYVLKGFYSMPGLADNSNNGAVARFGELSTHSKTFTRDEKNFANAQYANVELVTFKIVDENGVQVTPSSSFINKLLAIGNWLYQQHVGGNVPTNANKEAFEDSIKAEHSGVTNVKIGSIVNGITTSRNLIDYVTLNLSDADKKYDIKIWCSDSKFRAQYEDYIIYPIPAVQSIDDLYGSLTAVANLLGEMTASVVLNRVNELSDGFPYTKIATLDLTWHDVNNANISTKTTWYFVVHGDLGLDLDNLKNAAREYIAQHSDKTQWDKVYPELYSENEFIIVPLWNNKALPAGAATTSLYSSMSNVGDLSTIARAQIPSGYAQITNITTFMSKWLRLLSVYYRGMHVLAVSNPSNRGALYDIRTLYPDYTDVASTDIDFSRMEPDTRDFIIMLNTALDHANTMGLNSAPPTGFNKITRGSKQYLAFNLKDYYFLVLLRESY